MLRLLEFSVWLGEITKGDAGPSAWDALGSVLGWVFGAAGAIAVVGSAIWARRTGKETVVVNEKDAQTRAVAQVIEALTEGLNELRIEVKSEKETNKVLRTELDQVKKILDQMRNERFEMIEHIEYLESIVPTPPGIPPRPAQWDYISPR